MFFAMTFLVALQAVSMADLPADGSCPDPKRFPQAVCVQVEPVAVQPVVQPKLKPKIKLTASPPLVAWSPVRPRTVQITLVITDATEDLWCPAVDWVRPDTTHSMEEHDCLPYERAETGDRARQTWRIFFTPVPGASTVGVVLSKAGKVIKRDSIKIGISSEPGEGY